ncbi:MAG: DNA primase catalytic subunit PriS [Methanomethylophilus sp.]|nr:DNA primase catalytic subunit PriS [Methanomethylophilus sp.]
MEQPPPASAPPSPSARPELDANSRFLFKLFRRYYRTNEPLMPDRFTKREFGFIPFGRTMQRHLGFTSPEDLRAFLISRVPAHSYYSTAYYRYPAKPVMEEKEWMGAELIFDLDADHLAGADQMTYSEMMVQIRKEMISLVDDYLTSDLGFAPEQVHLCFSGGRGYHAHVRTDDIFTLGTHERRELVDYISGTGLDLDWVFPLQQDAVFSRNLGNGTSVATVHRYRLIPAPEEGGWKHKMRRALGDVCVLLETADPKDIKKEFPSVKGSDPKVLARLGAHLKGAEHDMFARNSMADLDTHEQDLLIKILGQDVAPRLASEIDKPVTPDIKRLIRLPGSLHGKTGLRVTPITRDELTHFDPLQSAVPSCYTDEPVKVTMRRDLSLDILDQSLTLHGETEVPEYAASFLIGRKYADYGWLSERSERLF